VKQNEAVRELIKDECYKLAQTLLNKNSDYGASALKPLRVFSKACMDEQLLVRIDDKLSRIQNLGADRILNSKDPTAEDTLEDLIGYLILLKVRKRLLDLCGLCFEEGHQVEDCPHSASV
jgi:hypothetical protein